MYILIVCPNEMCELKYIWLAYRPSHAPSPSSSKAFRFPKRQFGSMGEERSFCTEWCDVPGSGSSTVHSLLSTKAKISITTQQSHVCNVIMRVGVKHELQQIVISPQNCTRNDLRCL